MNTINWYAVVVIAITIFMLVISWVYRARPQCPECGSSEIGLTRKEQKKMVATTHATTGNSLSGGGGVTASIVYQAHYSCNVCEATWQTELIESG